MGATSRLKVTCPRGPGGDACREESDWPQPEPSSATMNPTTRLSRPEVISPRDVMPSPTTRARRRRDGSQWANQSSICSAGGSSRPHDDSRQCFEVERKNGKQDLSGRCDAGDWSAERLNSDLYTC